MGKQHLCVPGLIHRAFAAFLTIFLMSYVGKAFAGQDLPIIAQQGGDSQRNATRAEAKKLTLEGIQLLKQGTKESLLAARKKFEAALVLWLKLDDKGSQATIITGIGRICHILGEKQKALQFYNQALPLRRAVGDRGGEALTLTGIGGVYSDLGEKQKALQFYNQALPLYRAVGDRDGEATTLNKIGGVYSDLGEKQKALQFYNQALLLLRAVGDRGGEATTLNLSACETGLGKNVNGEGLVGLTRGLMYAGGARVALSLWQVSDKGTSVLMQEFYRQMLQENKTPSQALWDTQRKLWANPEWRSPYYWAAFTLQGEWKFEYSLTALK